jgi:hypothetical protein
MYLRNIALVRVGGVTGHTIPSQRTYDRIERVIDGLTPVLADFDFVPPEELGFYRPFGDRYHVSYFLTGERTYSVSFILRSARPALVQCGIQIDRKNAVASFTEMDHPSGSGRFPTSDAQRQRVRAAARSLGDYFRRTLPTHDVNVTFSTPYEPANYVRRAISFGGMFVFRGWQPFRLGKLEQALVKRGKQSVPQIE